MKRTVYIISGPAGVGKSTTSEKLVKSLDRSAYISGDDISHLPVNGREKPWLSESTVVLTWKNIISLTKNLIDADFDVVIDYVTFPYNLDFVKAELKDYKTDIVYVVLMVELNELIYRDRLRPAEIQMGERSIILHREFEEAMISNNHILNTSDYSAEELEEIIELIKTDTRFFVR